MENRLGESQDEQEKVDGALLHAAAHLDVDALKQALADGANPNAQELSGKRPLHLLMQTFPSNDPHRIADVKECVARLVALGADVNAPDSANNRPIHDAVMKMNETGLIALLEAGADVNARGFDGLTALHYAAGMYITAPSRILLAAGADVDVMTSGPHQLTPLQMASRQDVEANIHLLEEVQNDPSQRPHGYHNIETGERLDLEKRIHALHTPHLRKDSDSPTQTLTLSSLTHEGKQSKVQISLN